jgi:hypothetical protein
MRGAGGEHGGMPPLFHEPVWYGPLREPDWLLPPLRDGAPRVLFVPATPASDGASSARAVSGSSPPLGLALFLAEAVRYSTDARSVVATGRWDAVTSPSVIVRPTFSRDEANHLRIRIDAPDGSTVDELRHDAPDDASLADLVVKVPAELVASLRQMGVHAMWSTVFRSPPAPVALLYVRAHRECATLQDPNVHHAREEDADAVARRRAAVKTSLGLLAEASSKSRLPLAAAMFAAGLAVTKGVGSSVFFDFRLQANALSMGVEDPRDPVFRLSVLLLSLFGERDLAERRSEMLKRSDDEAIRSWITRVRAGA